MRKVFVFAVMILFLGITLCSAQEPQEESITITTYYPSPYGVYRTMRLSPSSRPDSCQEGELYYDDGTGSYDAGLYWCDDTPAWQAFGGGGFWAVSPSDPNDIYNTNTGNIGIGTASPGAKLEVLSSDTSVGVDIINATSGAIRYGLTVQASGATSGIGVAAFGHGPSGAAVLGQGSGAAAGVRGYGDEIGVRGSASDPGYGVYGSVSNLGIPGGWGIYCDAPGGSCGGNTAWSVVSDARLKTNTSTITNALDTVQQLRGVTFNWKDPERGDALEMGFVAQEVFSILPELVDLDPQTDLLHVKESSFAPLLLEAIKEQQAQIKELQVEIERLRAQLSELRGG
jgi:hypothetical protein